MFLNGTMEGFSEFRYKDPQYEGYKAWANDDEAMAKSLTTGAGIVQAGDVGGRALRTQLLDNVLENATFEQDDIVFMKIIRKEKVYSNTFEWSQFNSYGGPGDGFVGESGFDQASLGTGAGALFGQNSSDDVYTRLLRQVKYLAAVRNLSLPIQTVKNIANPVSVAENSMIMEIIAKANLALYDGDSLKSGTQFDGIKRQLIDWLSPTANGGYNHPEDQVILYDAGGAPIDKVLLEELKLQNKLKYGNGSLLLQSAIGFADTQKLLFPETRGKEGETGTYGLNKSQFITPYGTVTHRADISMRPNQPLVVDGPGVTGLPRGTADLGALSWSSVANAFASGAAVAAGAGLFWQYCNLNSDTAVLATAPALPAGEGNQGDRLAAGTYYYCVSIVYQGRESLPFSFSNQTVPGVVGTLTGITKSAGSPVIKIQIDDTQITIPAGVSRSLIKLRIYRAGGPGVATPTLFSQFSFLGEAGLPTAGNIAFYDNGMFIPGLDNAYLLTEHRNKTKGFIMAQLLPLMRRELPEYLMGNPLAYLYFAAPIFFVPKHHIWVRNVGRAN